MPERQRGARLLWALCHAKEFELCHVGNEDLSATFLGSFDFFLLHWSWQKNWIVTGATSSRNCRFLGVRGTRMQPVQGDSSCIWDIDQGLGLWFKEDLVPWNKVSEDNQDPSLVPKFRLCFSLVRVSKTNYNTKIRGLDDSFQCPPPFEAKHSY